jgi:alkylated DNA repair dioxygenase AlkB
VLLLSEDRLTIDATERVFYTEAKDVTMLQSGLFDVRSTSIECDEGILAEGALPAGLTFVPDFVSASEEDELLEFLDDPRQASWSNDLARRVQHFGFRYNYKLRAVSAADRVPDAPPIIQALGERLVDLGYFTSQPDQIIVNEYQPGQGISPHIDRETCFGSSVASLSLGSDAVMDFRSPSAAGAVLLRARSLVVLMDDARYSWQHSIAQRRNDEIAGLELTRRRRVSLTFRTVVLGKSSLPTKRRSEKKPS